MGLTRNGLINNCIFAKQSLKKCDKVLFLDKKVLFYFGRVLEGNCVILKNVES